MRLLAKYVALGAGCLVLVIGASLGHRAPGAPRDMESLLSRGASLALTHGVVRSSEGFDVIKLDEAASSEDVLAFGGYSPGRSRPGGFGELKIESFAGDSGDDGERFYAAGVLEGWLTYREIVSMAAPSTPELCRVAGHAGYGK